jgi:DNA-binding NarL/FixJ family response regulator
MGTQKLKIIIVDDHQAFINAIKIFLRKKTNIEVVGEANDALQFQEILRNTFADIILMDINMPDIDGLSAGKKALNMERQVKLLGVTMSDDYDIHLKMLEVGFSGGILKNQFTRDFDKAIDKINNGEVFFPVLNG